MARPRLGVDIEIELHQGGLGGGIIEVNPRLTVGGRRILDEGCGEADPILNVPVFFRSLTEPGRLPLYSDASGTWDLHYAYWVEVTHAALVWRIRFRTGEAFAFSWDEVEAVAETIERVIGWAAIIFGDRALSNGLISSPLNGVRLARDADGSVQSNRLPWQGWMS